MKIENPDFSRKRVFLSGPMTGRPDWNRVEFAEAAQDVFAAGANCVFNPAATAPEGEDPHTHEHWMLDTLHELTSYLRAGYEGDNVAYWDVIAMLPGWQDSAGARMERAVAEACGIRVVEL